MVEKLLAGEQGPSSQPGELILGTGQGSGVPCRDRATPALGGLQQHWVSLIILPPQFGQGRDIPD